MVRSSTSLSILRSGRLPLLQAVQISLASCPDLLAAKQIRTEIALPFLLADCS